MKRNNQKRAFTIVELVIVIAVIAILAAVLIPTYSNLVKKANAANAQIEAKNLITEMLAEILTGDKDATDLLVFSHKGKDVYLHGYDASEGRVITYNGVVTEFTGDDFNAFVNNFMTNGSCPISVEKDETVADDDWRNPTKTAEIVSKLDAGDMVVFANYKITAGILAKQTVVSNAEDLKNAFKNAKAGEDVCVSLTGDMTITEQTLMLIDQNTPDIGDVYIQGNGKTLTNNVDNTRCVQLANFTSGRTITISNLDIVSGSTAKDSSERRGIQIFDVNNATINIVNCNIRMASNDYSYPVKIGGTSSNLTVNITGCKFTGANCIESFGTNCTVNITDCTLTSNYGPHATYCGNGIQDKNGTNNTYNIKNTTFNGTNAQPWQTSSTTTINDLGGNTYNTTRTTK